MTVHHPTSPEWGTLLEAAAFWGVHTRTIRRMIARGEIEARRIGPRLIRVRLDRLDETGHSMQHDA